MPRLKFSETGFMAVLKTRIKISRNDLYLKTSHRFSFMLNKVHVQLLRTVTHSSATQQNNVEAVGVLSDQTQTGKTERSNHHARSL